MKVKPRYPFSPVILSILLTLVLAGSAVGDAGAEVPGPALEPEAATTAQLNAVRAAISAEATTLTLEVSGGEFSYLPSEPGGRLVVVDLPGVLSTLPQDSHLLDSRLVSSYRLVSFTGEGRPSARLEVLLKRPAKVTWQQTAGALQVKFAADRGASPSVARASSPVEAPARARRARGTAIERVVFDREDQATRVRILADGPVEYRAFQLEGPPRLVLDIPGTESRTANREIQVGMGAVRSIRVAQFSHRPLVSRVVMDLDNTVSYRVYPRPDGVEVEVGTPASPEPAEAPAPARAEPERPPVELAQAAPPDDPEAAAPAEAPPSAAPVSAASADPPAPSAPATGTASVESFTVAPPAPMATPVSPAAGAAAEPEAAPASPAMPPLAPMNVAAATAPAAAAAGPPRPQQLQPAMPGPAAPEAVAAGARYTGEPISVNLRDVDLRDFFRLIHEVSGLNIVLDPVVSGRLTIVLEDVPWDQALDIVLRNNQLDKQLEGNVLRIARRATLRAEEEERLALEQAKQAAAERVTVLRPLNYARAAQMVQLLSKFRSPRGEMIADDRTNTLIITDIPQVIPTVDEIIRQLDRRSLQVEIEARVVAASRQFAREIGAQFGFGTTASGGRSIFTGNSVGGAGNASPLEVTGAPQPFEPQNQGFPLFSNFPAAGSSSGFTFIHRSPNAALDLLISFAETKGVGKLLSRPRIITQNNVQGEVQQGVRIPVQTTVNNTISVQFTNVTLRLTVRPQVTNEGAIFLDIAVENTSIDPGIARINGVPALNTQSATTQVLVNDGGTIVFGGVLQNSNNLTIQQVPILGSIPVIGNLFKRTGISTQTNELLFFITPKIV